MWLTAVGAVLFLLVGLLWGLSGSGAEAGSKAAAPAGAASAAGH